GQAPWAAVGPGAGIPAPQSATVAVTDEHELEDEADARRRKIILWSSLGAAALIAIILIIVLLNQGEDEPEIVEVTVPNVVEMTEEAALAELESVGLVGDVVQEASDEID